VKALFTELTVSHLNLACDQANTSAHLAKLDDSTVNYRNQRDWDESSEMFCCERKGFDSGADDSSFTVEKSCVAEGSIDIEVSGIS
jgi:hypothetical protein